MRVVAEGLAALRGERIVFRHVNFDLAPGQVLVLHGPNGSGKTTLLRVLAGLLGLMAGRLRLLGKDDKPLLDERRDQALHFISGHDLIRPQLRIDETLRFHAAMLGAPAKNVAAALEAWDLTPLAETSTGLLSAGQRRRLALARLSLQERDLWLLDEPLVALDADTRIRLTDICNAHLEKGGLIIAASHEPFLNDPHTLHFGSRP